MSLLKAHRLARGWTARVAIDQLLEVCERERLDPPHANIDLLNAWENGRARPRPDTADRLSRLYKANLIRLGFANDYSDDGEPNKVVVVPAVRSSPAPARVPDYRPEPPVLVPSQMHDPRPTGRTGEESDRQSVFHDVIAGHRGGSIGRVLAEVEGLRQQMDRTLASGTITEDQMDRMDEMVVNCRRDYLVTPPLLMLCQLMLEFSNVQNLAAQRQPGAIQCRLARVAAVLAVLSADALMKLGDIRQARAWYGTAKSAADDTGDPRLRALVRAQEAMLPYYYGDLQETVRLARQAQALSRATPCSPTALAAAAEGRALARMGDRDGANTALTRAQQLFGELSEGDKGALAFDFTEQRLYLYLSGAHAYLSNVRRAEAVHESALACCTAGSRGIDSALIRLDQATGLARSGREAEACELAAHTLLDLPPEQRTSIVFVRARDVRSALPLDRRSGKAINGLNDVLALESSSSPRSSQARDA
ncbi:helix-turn-helix domain-containing protein [Actinomadura fibrosa]|uniref:Helix-turn-helix domain-containing protein n=1 Tax=Actinomadura fibrosa TaxID=111802 RepID=A0ABW2XYQ1_9ACTN|nr:helix-turn-helix transcriptional regulator [Actinomadura fibrosa]